MNKDYNMKFDLEMLNNLKYNNKYKKEYFSKYEHFSKYRDYNLNQYINEFKFEPIKPPSVLDEPFELAGAL